jgi:rare lipoprotein A
LRQVERLNYQISRPETQSATVQAEVPELIIVPARGVPSTIREGICVAPISLGRARPSPTTNEELMLRLIIWIASIVTALSSAQAEEGIASHYDASSGSKVSCGGRLNEGALTAAHKTLPCGTKVKVQNKTNGKSVTVTINDRGPFVKGRVIDVTPAAARALGFSGLAKVTISRE